MARFMVVVSLFLLIAATAFAQGPDDPGAGLLPFSTQVGGAHESVDLATSNVFVNIPGRSKVGKMPFDFSWSGNFHPWIAPINLGQQWRITAGLNSGASGLLGGSLSYVIQSNPQCANFIDLERVVYGILDGTRALHAFSPPVTVHTVSNCGPTS